MMVIAVLANIGKKQAARALVAVDLDLANRDMDLSRFRAAPGARLGHLAFESDRAFPTQC